MLGVDLVDRGDFQFTAGRRFNVLGDIDNLVVIEVEVGHGITALGFGWLLFNREGFAVAVKLDDTVTLKVFDVISKDRGARGLGIGTLQQRGEIMAIIEVSIQNQGAGAVAHMLLAKDKRLGQPIRGWLYTVAKIHIPLRSIAKQLFKTRGVLRGRDNEHILHAGHHQAGERVVDHGLVVHRQQLLRD